MNVFVKLYWLLGKTAAPADFVFAATRLHLQHYTNIAAQTAQS